jgi:(S)-3,5-dihydroxyphenylglycine transaminase
MLGKVLRFMASAQAQDSCVRAIELRDCFSDPLLDAMNFLNEITLDFPKAISFAPGRPLEQLFHVEDHLNGISDFVAESAHQDGTSPQQVWQELGQYNRTNGTINALIAKHLEIDEGINVDPSSIIVTVGAQEAMAILMAGLFDPQRDILLASDPTYIGITGLARILGVRVVPVPSLGEGLNANVVAETIRKASCIGKVRALYDIPDFNNPLGTSIPLQQRKDILQVCSQHGVFIFEDNPYGMFWYDSQRMPTLKALDSDATVIYIGTFSKTLFPGLRLGYLVADQKVVPHGELLAVQLSKVKSLITVNTSSLSQAVAGAALMRFNGSLEPIVQPKRSLFRQNRDTLLASLAEEFAGFQQFVSWNRPGGGFFMTVNLPFSFGMEEVRCCAADYGVIICPMQLFSLASDSKTKVRLSFSYVNEDQIRCGVQRLATFVRDQCSYRGIKSGTTVKHAASNSG